MKNLFYILILFSLSIQAQNKHVSCDQDNTVRESPTVVQVDTLFFEDCARGFLIQDNAILHIKHVVGLGEIRRGGKSGAPRINGLDRFEGDANPLVVLIGCPWNFETLEIGPFIDITIISDFCNEN